MKDILIFRLNLHFPHQTPDLAGRALVSLLNSSVKTAHASEAGGERDFAEGQTCFVNQLFCEVEAACLCDGAGRGAQVTNEEATEMARADADALGKILDAAIFKPALSDEPQSA
jgi:hypothetical protein